MVILPLYVNKGPCLDPLIVKYGRRAETAWAHHVVSFPQHKCSFLKGSVFDCLILIAITSGFCLSSTDISLKLKCTTSSKVS